MGIFNEQSFDHPFAKGIQGAPGVGFKLTVSGDFDITGKKLTNVGTPSSNADAATKKYVDDNSGGSPSTSRLTIDSNIDMKSTYRITNLKTPVDGKEPPTKDYVDNTFLERDGSYPMKGNLNMDNNKIINLKPPTSNTDAATKKYVDDNSSGSPSTSTLTVNSDIDMKDRFRITNLKEPSDADDAATKQYADIRFLYRNGSHPMVANLSMNNNKIINLGAPTSNTDASTKKYVDDKVSAIPSPDLSDYLEKDGSVAMTGNLNMGNNTIIQLKTPTMSGHAATKKYVDDSIPDTSSFIKKDGSVSMTGDFNLAGHKILNLRTPTSNSEAATKKYVDDNSGSPDLSDYLEKDGSVTMTGNLDMGNKKIVSVDAPTANTDASTKKYVDDSIRISSVDFFKKDGTVAMTGNLNMGNKSIISLAEPKNSSDAVNMSWVKNQIQHFNVLSSPVFTITAAPAYTTIYLQYQRNRFVFTTSRPAQPLISWKPASGTYINKIVFNNNRSVNVKKVSFVARDSRISDFDFWVNATHTGLWTLNIHRTFTYEISGVFLDFISDANSNHPPITTNIYTGKPSAETKVFSKIKFSSPTEFTSSVTAQTPSTSNQVATKDYVDKSVAGPAHYKNVFDYIMTSASQWSDEITTRTSFVLNRFADLSPNSGNFHSYNHKVAYFTLKKYSDGYKFKIGLNFFRLAASDYTICLEFLNSDYRLWHKTQISVDHQSSSGITFHSESVKKLTHTYYYPAGNLNSMYYHRVIVSFTKNNTGRSFFHVTINMPQVNGDMISYPNDFTKFYGIVYGINGAVGNIDPDKSYDYHTAFDIQSSQVVYNVDINANNNHIKNLVVDTNPSSAATLGLVWELRSLLPLYYYYNLFGEFWDFKNMSKYETSGASSSSSFSFNRLKGIKNESKKISFPSKGINNINYYGLDVNNYSVDIPLENSTTNLCIMIVFYFWDNNNFKITRYDTNNSSKLFEITYDKLAKRLLLESGGRNTSHNLPAVKNGDKFVLWVTQTNLTNLKFRFGANNTISLIGFGRLSPRNQKVTFYSQGGFLNKVMIVQNSNIQSDNIIMQEKFI